MMNVNRRVAVTGLGVCSSLGIGTNKFWNSLMDGTIGIFKLSDDFSFLPSRIAGIVSDKLVEDEKANISSKLLLDHGIKLYKGWKDISRSSSMAIIAVNEALNQVKWKHNSSDLSGVCFGTGMEGIREICESNTGISSQNYSAISPFALTRSLGNMPSGIISKIWGLRGPCISINAACATGLHSIGEAYRMIQHGEADMVVAGGSEAALHPWSVAAFCRIRALSTKHNDEPQKASCPFDQSRDGFVISEGAGAVVLQAWPPDDKFVSECFEECPSPIAEIIGFGRSADAHNLVSPEPSGNGALRSMLNAIKDSQIRNMNDIGHVNCHATSTMIGDMIELGAIGQLIENFTQQSSEELKRKIVVNSIKGQTGHLLGAAGAIECIYTILSVNKGLMASNRNLMNPITLEEVEKNVLSHVKQRNAEFSFDKCLDLMDNFVYLPKDDIPALSWTTDRPRIALTNSFGFGGTNSSLMISEWRN